MFGPCPHCHFDQCRCGPHDFHHSPCSPHHSPFGPHPPHHHLIVGEHDHHGPHHMPPPPKKSSSANVDLTRMIAALTARVNALENRKLGIYSFKRVALDIGYVLASKAATASSADTDAITDCANEWKVYPGTTIEGSGGETTSSTGELEPGAIGVPLSGINVASGRHIKLIIPPTTLTSNVIHQDIAMANADVAKLLADPAYVPLEPKFSKPVAECPVCIHVCCCNTPKCCHHGCHDIMTKAVLFCKIDPTATDATAEWSITIFNNASLPKGTVIPRVEFNFLAKDKWEVTMEKATDE